MDVFEISGFSTGKSEEGVNFLQPSDSFQNISNGFIFRQVLQSRQGFTNFASRLADQSRVTGIFQFTKTDGTKDLLATDMNFLYKYNTATNVFDQISFAGSLAGYGGFNIGNNASYVSVAAYPSKSNGSRFIICGEGISAAASGSSIFFYNGTDVRDYTNVADNPDYAIDAAALLTRAKYVKYFNERINFFVPTVTTPRRQGVLYSGIRDSAGNGDKFNVSGSGLIQFSTSALITGVEIVAETLNVLMEDGARILEITTDAFNPYRLRNVSALEGTDAPFSSVSRGNVAVSIGREGILQNDTRESLRIDNKIPNFVYDSIEVSKFDLIYGGFDRINSQFLWSYVKAASGDSTQNKVLVRNYEEGTWSTYDMRISVIADTNIGQNLNWNQISASDAHPTWGRWDTTEEIWSKIGLGADVKKTLVGDDLGFIYEMNSGYDDHTSRISAISQASNAVVTVDACGIQAGDEVVISNVEGMTEINNFDPSDKTVVNINTYTVISATPTSITLNVDSSLFTAYTSGGTISKPIKFSAELIPLNPYRKDGRKFFIQKLEFLLNTNAGKSAYSMMKKIPPL